MSDFEIPFDPWLGSAFVVTDAMGNQWVPIPMNAPVDPETGEYITDEGICWDYDNEYEPDITFFDPGEMTTGPAHLVGVGIIDPTGETGVTSFASNGDEIMRPIEHGDTDAIRPGEMYMELGKLCFAIQIDENHCATLGYEDGMLIFSDEDTDGIVDHLQNICFDGTNKRWKLPYPPSLPRDSSL